MDSIKEKLKSMESDIEEAKIEEVIKTRNEVEKKVQLETPCLHIHLVASLTWKLTACLKHLRQKTWFKVYNHLSHMGMETVFLDQPPFLSVVSECNGLNHFHL